MSIALIIAIVVGSLVILGIIITIIVLFARAPAPKPAPAPAPTPAPAPMMFNLGLKYDLDSDKNQAFPKVQNLLEIGKEYACKEEVPASEPIKVSCDDFNKSINESVDTFVSELTNYFPSMKATSVEQLKKEAQTINEVLKRRLCVNGEANPNKFMADINRAICASKSQVPVGYLGTTYLTNDPDIRAILESFNSMLSLLVCNIDRNMYTDMIVQGENLNCEQASQIVQLLVESISTSLTSEIPNEVASRISSNFSDLLNIFIITKGCGGNVTSETQLNKQSVADYMQELNSSLCPF